MHAVLKPEGCTRCLDPSIDVLKMCTSELWTTPLKILRISRANMGSTSVPWSLHDGIIFSSVTKVSKIGAILADGVRHLRPLQSKPRREEEAKAYRPNGSCSCT